MKCLILTNGTYGDYKWCETRDFTGYDFIICADNGMKHARALGITPHMLLGDFDSCSLEDLMYFKAQNIEIQQLPSEKDETDTELAVDLAIKKGATSIEIFGGIGSRFDHSLANVHLLYRACMKNIVCWIVTGQNKMTLVKDELILQGQKSDLVSLLPFTEVVKGVCTTGLAYALDEGEFMMGKPYGVSNYLISEQAKVTIRQGLLLVILAED